MTKSTDKHAPTTKRSPALQRLYELAKKRAFLRRSMEVLGIPPQVASPKTNTP